MATEWLKPKDYCDRMAQDPGSDFIDRGIGKFAGNVLRNGNTGEKLAIMPFLWLWGLFNYGGAAIEKACQPKPPVIKPETEKQRQKRLRKERDEQIRRAKQLTDRAEREHALRWIEDHYRSQGIT